MTNQYEHEITFKDDEVMYILSDTNYLNVQDVEFLSDELQVDLSTIKSISTEKI